MIDSYAALAAAIESKGFIDYPVRFFFCPKMCSPNPVVLALHCPRPLLLERTADLNSADFKWLELRNVLTRDKVIVRAVCVL